MALPGQGRQKLQSTQAPTSVSAAPEIEPWGDVELFPSLLLTGATGTGKTDAIGKLCEAGFNLVVLMVEDKRASLQRWKPEIIDINKITESGTQKRMPTEPEKYDRLMRFLDKLRSGGYREYSGKIVDILAVDSLTEIADVLLGGLQPKYSASDTLKMWGMVGDKTIEFFKSMRDAAGVAASKMGTRPMGIVCTCLEGTLRKINVQSGGYNIETNVPILRGNVALPRMVPAFEVAWRLSAGSQMGGAHEYRIHTQKTEDYEAKSPAGILEGTVTGPGGLGNDPDVGKMYTMLLEHEESPYRRVS